MDWMYYTITVSLSCPVIPSWRLQSLFREYEHTQARCLRLWRPSLSVISAAFMAFYQTLVSAKHNTQSWLGEPDILQTYRQILLVGEDQEDGVPELVLVQHALQFLPGLDNTIAIVAVDDEDDTLGVLEVVSPERSDLVLPTDIPHGELDVLVLDGLDVESFSTH